MPASFLRKVNLWRSDARVREIGLTVNTGLFIALLPFQWSFPPISLMIMILGGLFIFFLSPQYLKRMASGYGLWLMAAYYLWMAVAAIYSGYPQEAGLDIMLSISLIAWPLGFAVLGGLSRHSTDRLLILFVRILAVAVIMALVIALINWREDGGIRHFFYQNFAPWEMVPSHYFSMYISFALLVCAERWIRKGWPGGRWRRVEAIGFITLFLVAQTLLSVRIQFIALPMALAPLLIFALRRKMIGKRAIRIGILLGIGVLITLFLLPGTQRRITDTWHEIRSFSAMVDQKQTNHRVYLWNYSAEVIGENTLWGTGTGAANKALHEKLLTSDARFWDGEKTYYLYEKEYNAHNQFLQSWMTYGIIGFLILLAILFLPMFRSVQQKDWLSLGFLILCVISFSTESMLERQAGVLWFAVFYSLLVVSPHSRGRISAATKMP